MKTHEHTNSLLCGWVQMHCRAEDAFHFRALNIHPVREGEGGRGREMREREGEIRRQ